MLRAEDLAAAVRDLDGDDVNHRTVHFYTQAGILPDAIGRGRNAYTPEHLVRFRIARKWARQGQKISEIRKRMATLSSRDVAAELEDLPQAGGEVYALADLDSTPFSQHPSGRGNPERAMALSALSSKPGAVPKTLRFPGHYALSVPEGADDDTVADIYSAVMQALARAERRNSKSSTEA